MNPINSIMNTKTPSLIQWVLVETSHPGNVGSAARALKTMGFENLHLIHPKIKGIHREPEAIALASGALEVLEKAQESQSLEKVVQGCSLVLGLTSRDREFGPPVLDWESALELVQENVLLDRKIALLFGPERTGLDNEHLALCSHRVYLEANPEYPSLNLAQAVMVCAYSVRQTLLSQASHLTARDKQESQAELADPAAIAAMLDHWQAGLEAIGYLDPANPKKLMPRLQALFARSRLHKEEIDLLRGIAKQMILRK
jgi:tRNA/rRNA methyltransferase